ncbi:MAG: aldolase [Ruminococcaceae bacterium]|nr:aldolase [Oscillospiraceae bacterium]
MENEFRKALNSGRRLLGTHVNLTDYRMCEMLGYIGFDYLWIDMEHLSTDFQVVEMHLIAAKSAGTPCMVRVTWNDIPDIKRVLEMGPAAIVVPMVNSVEEAQKAIDTCIYPPLGKRGFGPCRAVRYGLDTINEYIEERSYEVCLLLQVETRDAVEALDEICKIPYVDGFVIGPMNLSGSVGALGHALEDAETNRLIERAIGIAHAHGKPIGLSTGADNEAELLHWMSKGVDFISASTDMWSVLMGAKTLLAKMKDVSERCPLEPKEGAKQ